MHPLDGCRAKIQRAQRHIEEFAADVSAFVEHAPYTVRVEQDRDANEFVFIAQADSEIVPVPPDLILVAGEVAHQLRSSLDPLAGC